MSLSREQEFAFEESNRPSSVRPSLSAVLAQLDTPAPDQQLHVAGAKADAGKLRAGLVLGGFSRALKAVAEVGTFGANKYTANGWLTVPNGLERYEDAGERHRLDRRTCVFNDPESGLMHRAHEAWNALALLELELRALEEFPNA